MKGQADLISAMIMVGVVLVIGIAALSYFNSSMAVQRAELQLQSFLVVESSRTITSVVYSNGTDYVIFLTKRETGVNFEIVVLGMSEGSVKYTYLSLGSDYEIYYADPALGVPYYNLTDLSGWSEVSSLIKDARRVYVKNPAGTSPYLSLSEFCDNLPVGGGVSVGRLSVEANEPVLLRVHLEPGLGIDTAWVMILIDVGGSSYQIAAVPLPYHD